jgi:hypothetical protein
MEKEFVPIELAIRLKNIGYNEEVCAWSDIYTNDIAYMYPSRSSNMNRYQEVIFMPTWQSAFRWFRKKYQLHSTITSISQESWQWHITKPGESLGKLYDEDFYTYEEAKLACLEKLLEIVESKSE